MASRLGGGPSVFPGENVCMTEPSPGTYRHYKGNLYEVIDVARHSETEEQLVVYRALYGERGLWLRPLDMFSETVEVDGVAVPRFAAVDQLAPGSAPDGFGSNAGPV